MRQLLLAFLLLYIPCFGEIRAIIFDYGGVMTDLDTDILTSCLEERMNIPPASPSKELIKGLIDEEEFWGSFAGGVLPEDWEVHFQQAYIEACHPKAGMGWLVQYLGQQGYMTPLLSNSISSCAAINETEGRYRIFDPVILSCEVGMAKPDPEIYIYALGLLGLEADECLVIDDNMDNITTARALGMEAIHFEGFEPLCIELHQRGLLRRKE